MTKKTRVYVVGKGYMKPEKVIAKQLHNQAVAAAKRDNEANRTERAMRKLRADHFLEKSFDWHKTPNTRANDFYSSQAWAKVRYAALIKYNGRCVCCGFGAADGVRLHVDHIKPRSKFPELALDLENLQVLCETCNLAKSNVDDTDWRKNGIYEEGSLDEYSDARLQAFLSSL